VTVELEGVEEEYTHYEGRKEERKGVDHMDLK